MFVLKIYSVCFILCISWLFLACQPAEKFESVDVETFNRMIQEEDVQRLDVRTLAEFTEGHIAGALNLNVMDEAFAVMADSLLQKEKPVALYCRSGKRSKRAAKILAEKGYRVYELDKGFNSWQQAGKEIER